jgi:hypothetical protein
MSRAVVITIEGYHPTPINRLLRMHWAKRDRILRAEYALIAAHARAAGAASWRTETGALLPHTRKRVEVTFVLRPGQRACDPDAQLKGLLDGLCRCGAIADDSRTWIDLAPVRYERGVRWGTVVRISEAKEDR